jgi:hypothetical protein
MPPASTHAGLNSQPDSANAPGSTNARIKAPSSSARLTRHRREAFLSHIRSRSAGGFFDRLRQNQGLPVEEAVAG